MTDADERQPLLSAQRNSSGLAAAAEQPRSTWSTVLQTIRERQAVYRVFLVASLMFTSTLCNFPQQIEVSRALACAEYYQRFPTSSNDAHTPGSADLASASAWRTDLCDQSWVEAQSAKAISITNTFGSLFSLLAVTYLQPRLHRYGLRSIFQLSIALLLVDKTASLVLPIGYPYGLPADQSSISPILSRRLFIFFTCIGSLLGGEFFPVMCLRMVLTRISSANDRTGNLVQFSLMNIIALAVGPSAIAALGSLFPFSFTSTDALLLSVVRHVQAWLPVHHSPDAPSPQIVPSAAHAKPPNVAPFFFGILVVLTTLVLGSLLVDWGNQHASDDGEQSPSPGKKGVARESMFYRIWPHRDADGNRDWRILLIVLTITMQLSAAYSLVLYIQFFGHALHWGQAAVAGLFSALGTSRVIVILGIVPLWTWYFERTVKRPSLLQGLSLEQIKTIAKSAPAVEAPIESAYEVANVEAAEDEDDLHSVEMRGAVSAWRAKVDRGVLHLSYIAEVVGWSLTSLFTSLMSTGGILFGGAVVAMGGASAGVRSGVELVIVGDVLTRSTKPENGPLDGDEDEDGQHADADHRDGLLQREKELEDRVNELYFPLLTFFESFAAMLSPIIATWLYNKTLDTVPAFNWLLAAGYYLAAYIIHFSMPVHKKSPRPVQQ